MAPPKTLSISVPVASPTRARYTVMGFLFGLAAIGYLDRVCISTASLAIQQDLSITKSQMGAVFSSFIICYAVFEIPGGWLADRFGPRVILTRLVVNWSLMTALTAAATGFWSLLIVRALFGASEAGMFPGAARVINRWFPERQRGQVFGLMLMTATLGGAAAQPLSVGLQQLTSWRWMFVIFASTGFVWAAAWYAWFRNDPHGHPAVNVAELELIGSHLPAPAPRVPWAQLVRSRNLWLICLMYFSTIYGIYFYLTWLPEYLQTQRGFDLRTAGWLSALTLVSMAAGNFLGGWLSDLGSRRFGRRIGRRLPGAIGPVLAAAAVAGAVSTSHAMASALLLASAAGLVSLGVSPAWAVCLDIGSRYAGVVSGAMTTFGCAGGAISTAVVGVFLDRFHSYVPALELNAAFYLVASGAWLVIDATKQIVEE